MLVWRGALANDEVVGKVPLATAERHNSCICFRSTAQAVLCQQSLFAEHIRRASKQPWFYPMPGIEVFQGASMLVWADLRGPPGNSPLWVELAISNHASAGRTLLLPCGMLCWLLFPDFEKQLPARMSLPSNA